MIIRVKKLRQNAVVPSIAYSGDVGLDLTIIGNHTIPPHSFADLPTGIAIEMPAGHWCLLKGRSSTIRKAGLMVTDGVIDAGYRGPLFVGVFNPSSKMAYVDAGARLAQVIPFKCVVDGSWSIEEVDTLTPSERGEKGFGSSGR